MNWDRILGNWKQVKGIVRQRWGRLTADYAGVVAGKRQHRLGRIQSAQGITTEADKKRLAEWLAREHKVDPIHK
ncbi:MAG TPA: general stress protein CsbD [Burkholderiales bacterium]|nr:general stress protein CsbD [Burkholderiales bacterium]